MCRRGDANPGLGEGADVLGKNFGKNLGNMGVGWGSNLLICNPTCPAIPPSLWFESNRAYQIW